MTIEEIRKVHYERRAKEQEKIKIAENLLKLGVEDEKIQEATGLSKEEIEELKKVEKN